MVLRKRVSIAQIFGRSPFLGIEELMRSVAECSAQLPLLIDALFAKDRDEILKVAKRTSQLEGVCDGIKDQIRERLPRQLFLPVDRRDLLNLLKRIDAIADCAEDVGVLLTLRPMETPEALQPLLGIFVERVLATVHTAEILVDKLDSLVQASFTGKVTAEARNLIEELHRKEHEADKVQDQLAKVLFSHESELPAAGLLMWSKVLNKIGDMANHAENVGDAFRLMLAR